MNVEVFNQTIAQGLLNNALKNDRLAQAYIFSGPEAIGKLEVARYFVNQLHCERLDENLKVCGSCIKCRKIKNNIFVDSLEVTLSDDKSTISIDQIRDVVLPFTKYSAADGIYKTCIVYPAEKMRVEAMNAFLKILEEPPKNFIFILITANHYMLLPTILSRCQLVKFSKQPSALIEKQLTTYFGVDTIKSKILATLSDGRLKLALKLLETDMLDKRSAILNNFIEALKRKELIDRNNFANYFENLIKKIKDTDESYEINNENTTDIQQPLKFDKLRLTQLYIEFIIFFMRDLFIYSITQDKQKLYNIDYFNDFEELIKIYQITDIDALLHKSFESYKYSNHYVRPLLISHNLFLNS